MRSGARSGKRLPGIGFTVLREQMRRSFKYQLPALLACTGAEIYYPVCRVNNVCIMLDHDDRRTGLRKAVKEDNEAVHIGGMQPG